MPEPYEEESRPTEMLSRYNSVISKHCINIKNSESFVLEIIIIISMKAIIIVLKAYYMVKSIIII